MFLTKPNLAEIQERVLVVDDEPNILRILSCYMDIFGLEADQAADGREAAELLAQKEYGLVISDIKMPVMDGMQLLLHIRKHHPDLTVLMISGYGQDYKFTDLIDAGASDFITKPFEENELRAKLQRIFRERMLLADLQASKEKEKSFFLHLVESLAISLDEKDQYTHGHSRRVTNLALQLAEYVTEEEIDMELLRLCGILHDIGKIGVPDYILAKPGKLTEEEYDIIKQHPERGAHILQPMHSDERIQRISHIIKHHHERFDGRGYPSGLQGDKIPLLSRIIAVADAYDAMTSDRPYRKAMDIDDAILELLENAGTQFDPALTKKFACFMRDCKKELVCPNLSTCEIFAGITRKDISKAYEMQYCRANFAACARYKIPDKKDRPDKLLPDGSYIR